MAGAVEAALVTAIVSLAAAAAAFIRSRDSCNVTCLLPCWKGPRSVAVISPPKDEQQDVVAQQQPPTAPPPPVAAFIEVVAQQQPDIPPADPDQAERIRALRERFKSRGVVRELERAFEAADA